MHNKTKQTLIKTDRVINVWETLAPDATFAGITLKQFKDAVKSTYDLKEKVASLSVEFDDARRQLADGTDATNAMTLLVIHGVRANPNYGENSPLYADMGYVRKSHRKSGLTRKKKTASAATTETE